MRRPLRMRELSTTQLDHKGSSAPPTAPMQPARVARVRASAWIRANGGSGEAEEVEGRSICSELERVYELLLDERSDPMSDPRRSCSTLPGSGVVLAPGSPMRADVSAHIHAAPAPHAFGSSFTAGAGGGGGGSRSAAVMICGHQCSGHQ
jgi:hypothetical protein